MSLESVEASLVMLGERPALIARPLPEFIDMEDVERGNGVTLLENVDLYDEKTRFEAYYDFHVPALRYVRRKE